MKETTEAEIVFRVDASISIGTGHVMRCLALASRMVAEGYRCHFVCRDHPGNLGTRILREGHRLSLLPVDSLPGIESATANADYSDWLGCSWHRDAEQTIEATKGKQSSWLIVDHYAIDGRWEKQLRAHCGRILAIDDLANRRHDCDVLVDQTPGRAASDYASQIDEGTECLVGPEYALLRPEFVRIRDESPARSFDEPLREMLISMGGVDQENATGRVLRELGRYELPDGCRISVAMGRTAPWIAEVQSIARKSLFPCRVLVDVADMARLTAQCDLAIGAGGMAALERCCVGLPSILVVLAENQRRGGLALAATGAAELIESLEGIEASLAPMLSSLLDPGRRRAASESARRLVDGRGIERVMARMGLQ